MKLKRPEGKIEIWHLYDWKFAISIDGYIQYTGTEEGCKARAQILVDKNKYRQDDEQLFKSIDTLK